MALGPTAVRPHVPRLILLWRNAFPRSNRELEAEKQRGDAFTWQVRVSMTLFLASTPKPYSLDDSYQQGLGRFSLLR